MGQFFSSDSSQSLDFTYVNDALVCWKPFYYIHIVWCYLAVISGFGCIVSRIHPKVYYLHFWMGLGYNISILWSTVSSLLITNQGIPVGALYTFLRRVLKGKPYAGNNPIVRMMHQMVTWKAVHGCLMMVSWLNMTGMIWVAPLVDFQCWTIPAYKPITTNQHIVMMDDPITLLPSHNPNYAKLPWGSEMGMLLWASMSLLLPYILSFVFGCVFVLWSAKPKSPSQITEDISLASKTYIIVPEEEGEPAVAPLWVQ
ncbi:hypothetical protein HDU98_008634 [Podochytrium sp. JEL0797]|nr:hypothetical protein HDU98_008634 [Podochytrium sp. JEL0797]